MPTNKDLKRLTRSHMQKTGESYTTARVRLLEKKTKRSRPGPEPAPDLAALAGMSDDTVQAKTGRTWQEWARELDVLGAAELSHGEIAALVHERFEISGWWSQTVTVGYERIRGLREIGQRRDGAYEASKSKTLPVPIAALYRACSDERTRRRWLPGVKLTVRKATPEKTMRITWDDGTCVELYFLAKGETKSQVAVQHRKLAARDDVARMKAYWGERLGALAEILASAST
jgi:uncharacterized protein YndB with AHSA1/START domain